MNKKTEEIEFTPCGSTAQPKMLTAIIIFAYIIGAFLRIHLLREQILINDEWHSMSIAITKSFSWILTNFTVPGGFTSTPLNLYEWLLLHSFGWSELSLHLPSVIFGMLCLFIAPSIAKNLIGKQPAITFTIFIATSPILIFYSRISRPYSAVACLGILCIIYAARWMKSCHISDGIGFAICGTLAIYWHLFAGVIIGTVSTSIVLTTVWKNFHSRQSTAKTLSWRQILPTMAGMAVAGTILILPALINSIHNSMADVSGKSTIHLSSIFRVASLFAGTTNTALLFMFWGLAAIGIIYLWFRNRWLTGTVAACFIMQIAALALIRPRSCDAGIVLSRYSVILIPVTLMLVAYGIESLINTLTKHKPLKASLYWLLISAFAITLFLAGPLPRIMAHPNNFTNHGIFQDSYEQIDWSKSFCTEFAPRNIATLTMIHASELSSFYAFLQENKNSRPIVEYPMLIGNHMNYYYLCQWYHERPIIIGYTAGMSPPTALKGGGVYGNIYIDEVLNLIEDRSQLKFHNFINMTNLAEIKKREVEYIIFHKQFEANFSMFTKQPHDMSQLLEIYKKKYNIIHEDSNVVVFQP